MEPHYYMKVLITCILSIILFAFHCYSPLSKNKINGVSFVSPPKPINSDEIKIPKEKINANWLSIMPYGFIRNGSFKIEYNHEWQWWGEKEEGVLKIIRSSKLNGYKIMLKPHIWITQGKYTGNLIADNETDWQELEKTYRNYVLYYAKIAQNEKVELFCIGTEWKSFIAKRKKFWINLIQEIKSIYDGKITYAANWDEYHLTPFWDKLDLIGLDAYFPISEKKTPSIEEIENNLKAVDYKLYNFSDSLEKNILFTEYGYRSKDYSGLRPWESNNSDNFNELAQSNLLMGFYNTFWDKEYISGGFIWKWFPNHENSGGPKNSGYTPQNKKAEKVISQFYN